MANNWTREELIVAFNLYCKIPFSKAVQTNPDVIQIAELIGRSPGAVAFKLGNFGSFDPELKNRGIGGLPNTSKLDRAVWDEFNSNWDNLAFESEQLIEQFKANRDGKIIYEETLPSGLDKAVVVKARVNQHFFRRVILSTYNSRCCLSGLSIPDLLIASHIKPWAVDFENRTNPRNGLCLNVLHDKAFDRGLISILPNYKVVVSKRLDTYLDDGTISEFFMRYVGKTICLPDKFLPSQKFLEYHYENIFLR